MINPATVQSSSEVLVKVFTSETGFENLRDAWETFQPFPEADLDFFLFIIKTRPNVIAPLVIAAYERGVVAGLVAARIEHSNFEIRFGYKKIWSKRVKRIVLPYGGLVGTPSREAMQSIFATLMGSLREQDATLLQWTGVRSGTPLYDMLCTSTNLFSRDHLEKTSEHWMISLPTSFPEFIEKRLGKRSRQWARRCIRDFEKNFSSKARYVCYTKPEDVERASREISAVAALTYQRGLGAGFYDNEEHRGRLALEAKKGWLRAYLLFVDEKPVAFWVGTLVNGTFYLTFTGFDPSYREHEVGSILFFHMIEDLCQNKVALIDFGLGTAYYKERFCDTKFEEKTFRFFAPRPGPIILNLFATAFQLPIDWLQTIIHKLGLDQRIKTLWRRTLAKGEKQS